MLYNKLKKYTTGDVYPFHMPGHKRNPKFMPDGSPLDGANDLSFAGANSMFALDVTEIHGFDDLHNPQGVLLETSKLAASLYGSREAFLLINGSTAGNLVAIGAHTKRSDKILADAGCHRSVPNAAELFGLEIAYITPGVDEASGVPCSVAPSDVEAALRSDPGIKMVIITSPGYEGVISDIAVIADITHKAGAMLLVDCAHGAHLGFSNAFPKSPVALGADVAVMSLHKTLPALTQCSLLHACSERADATAIKRMLSVLQTSSPSYVLMASIDYCLHLLHSDADELFCEYNNNLAYFRSRIENLSNLSVLNKRPGFFDFDPGKIVIVTKNTAMSSTLLAGVLREKYKLELERTYSGYAVAMTSICDTRGGFTRLADALIEVDNSIKR